MEPKIVSRPAFTVAGLVHRGVVDGEKIRELWARFGQRMNELTNVIDPQICYGVMANYDEATNEFDYAAAVRVASGEGLPAGFTATPIPAADWAVFTTTMAAMPETYPYIYGTWLPQSGYEHGPAPEYELYGETFDPADPAATLDICIPVVKAPVRV